MFVLFVSHIENDNLTDKNSAHKFYLVKFFSKHTKVSYTNMHFWVLCYITPMLAFECSVKYTVQIKAVVLISTLQVIGFG